MYMHIRACLYKPAKRDGSVNGLKFVSCLYEEGSARLSR